MEKEIIESICNIDNPCGSWQGGYDGCIVKTTKQEIKLLISSFTCCCEASGFFWCNEKPEDFIGAELITVSITDTALNTKLMQVNDVEEGGIMFVNIDTNRGVLQFVAYNSHNGYYGHDAMVECNQLKHYECL